MERELQKLSWTKFKNLVPDKIDTVLVPVGTIEAHGSSALGTDNYIPTAIAERQAERLSALIAPTLNYGITKSLYAYPGSLTVQPQSYTAFMADLFSSLVDQGFKYILVLNGHGGNNSALKEAAYQVFYQRGAYIAVVHWWELCDELTRQHFGEEGGHAGNNETACVQAIDPALTDKEEFSKEMAFHMRRGADIYPAPGSILLYKKGEGLPNFNPEQAKEYLSKAADEVGSYLLSILKQWKQIDSE